MGNSIKKITIICSVIIIVMLLIPPWEKTSIYINGAESVEPNGYGFIFSPPSAIKNEKTVPYGVGLDYSRLLIQIITVLLIGSLSYYVLSHKEQIFIEGLSSENDRIIKKDWVWWINIVLFLLIFISNIILTASAEDRTAMALVVVNIIGQSLTPFIITGLYLALLVLINKIFTKTYSFTAKKFVFTVITLWVLMVLGQVSY